MGGNIRLTPERLHWLGVNIKIDDMSLKKWFDLEMSSYRKEDVVRERRELLRLLDGDLFYAMRVWPSWLEKAFWRKPTSDQETFKVALFFIGNGCEPHVIAKWLLLSQHWNKCREKQGKRARQIQYIIDNVEHNQDKWFYFDLYHNKVFYLNGDMKI